MSKKNTESMRLWLRAATPQEREQLAKLAGTTVGNLNQIAGQYKGSMVGAALAVRLDQASRRLRKANPDLPALNREDLATGCGECDFVVTCRSLGERDD